MEGEDEYETYDGLSRDNNVEHAGKEREVTETKSSGSGSNSLNRNKTQSKVHET